MRIRMGILAVALAASLAACSDDPDPKSDSDSPSSGDSPSSATSDAPDDDVSGGSIDCPEFADIGAKIVEAQNELYAPSGEGDAGALDDLVAELDGLKEGAPEDIQEALSELGDGFERAAELLEEGTQQGQAELVALVPQLAEAGQKITEFVAEQCS